LLRPQTTFRFQNSRGHNQKPQFQFHKITIIHSHKDSATTRTLFEFVTNTNIQIEPHKGPSKPNRSQLSQQQTGPDRTSIRPHQQGRRSRAET